MPSIDIASLSDPKLSSLIANHRRLGATSEPNYVAALAESARRSGGGLDFETTKTAIIEAARDRRFISYLDIANASGVPWNKIHRNVGRHLDELLEWCHRSGFPLLTAIVVNKPNVGTGRLEESALRGFVEGARRVGYSVIDSEAFLAEQQRRVFDWAASES
jgi:hypothetical protein